jgi:hypothetical protein
MHQAIKALSPGVIAILLCGVSLGGTAQALTKEQAVAACKKRYGNTVFNALVGKDGKSYVCYWSNPAQPDISSPTDVRDFCKRKYGPMSVAKKQGGKWSCSK